jgi:hypothetical protein
MFANLPSVEELRNVLEGVEALKNGDLLLPVDVLDRCDKFKKSGH